MPESPFKTNLLQGQVALVVGGGTNICFDIALTLGMHGASIGTYPLSLHELTSVAWVANLEQMALEEALWTA